MQFIFWTRKSSLNYDHLDTTGKDNYSKCSNTYKNKRDGQAFTCLLCHAPNPKVKVMATSHTHGVIHEHVRQKHSQFLSQIQFNYFKLKYLGSLLQGPNFKIQYHKNNFNKKFIV